MDCNLTISYSTIPLLQRPEEDNMLLELSLRLLKYKGKDTIAFYFHEMREATIDELEKLDATSSQAN